MVALIDLLIALLPLMYGLAAVNYLLWFVRRDPFAAKFSTPWMLATVGVHALFLSLRALHFERHPIGNMAESLSVVAFALETLAGQGAGTLPTSSLQDGRKRLCSSKSKHPRTQRAVSR